MNSESRQVGHRATFLSALVIGCLAVTSAWADTGYVTDMLQLELYANQAMTGKPIRRLRSGDSFELLERTSRYAHVKMPDGQRGWLKSLYIVEKEPARTRLNKLEQELSGAKNVVNTLRGQLNDKQVRLDALEGDQSSAVVQLKVAEADLVILRTDRDDLERALSSYGSNVPLSWLIVGMILCLILGGYCGWYWIDRQSRSKHGGYRVY